MAKPSTDQHEGGIAVREAADHSGAAANYPVETLNDIVGTDVCPVLAGKMVVRRVSSIPSSTFWAAFLSFMQRSSSTTALAFTQPAFLLSWA